MADIDCKLTLIARRLVAQSRIDFRWRRDASVRDCVRLTECGGRELSSRQSWPTMDLHKSHLPSQPIRVPRAR